jgi:hypothetical protein
VSGCSRVFAVFPCRYALRRTNCNADQVSSRLATLVSTQPSGRMAARISFSPRSVWVSAKNVGVGGGQAGLQLQFVIVGKITVPIRGGFYKHTLTGHKTQFFGKSGRCVLSHTVVQYNASSNTTVCSLSQHEGAKSAVNFMCPKAKAKWTVLCVRVSGGLGVREWLAAEPAGGPKSFHCSAPKRQDITW